MLLIANIRDLLRIHYWSARLIGNPQAVLVLLRTVLAEARGAIFLIAMKAEFSPGFSRPRSYFITQKTRLLCFTFFSKDPLATQIGDEQVILDIGTPSLRDDGRAQKGPDSWPVNDDTMRRGECIRNVDDRISLKKWIQKRSGEEPPTL